MLATRGLPGRLHVELLSNFFIWPVDLACCLCLLHCLLWRCSALELPVQLTCRSRMLFMLATSRLGQLKDPDSAILLRTCLRLSARRVEGSKQRQVVTYGLVCGFQCASRTVEGFKQRQFVTVMFAAAAVAAGMCAELTKVDVTGILLRDFVDCRDMGPGMPLWCRLALENVASFPKACEAWVESVQRFARCFLYSILFLSRCPRRWSDAPTALGA